MHSAKENGGKHRKQTNSLKGHVAFVAAATGAVSTAAASGTVVAQSTTPVSHNIQLAANDLPAFGSSAPQILSIEEFKPIINFAEQLTKAIEYSEKLQAADELARTPKVTVAKPAEGVFTSGFGARWGTLHAGVDIANAMLTPILAVMDGEVISAGPASGFGQWVRLRHADGTVTVYGHIETIDVAVGQTVKAGQKIAGMGTRGFSTGPHLHFEVHPNGGGAIDPVSWLAERGIQL